MNSKEAHQRSGGNTLSNFIPAKLKRELREAARRHGYVIGGKSEKKSQE